VAVIMTLAMTLGVMSFTAMAETYEVGSETELRNAISSAQADDTITLTDDIEISIITISNDITLNLNGKTLSSMDQCVFNITSGTVTIQNGTIKNALSGIVCYGGKLTLKSVKIETETACISCSNSAVVNIEDGTSLSSDGTALIMLDTTNTDTTIVNVYSGATITGGYSGIEVQAGTLNVFGGTITSTNNSEGAGITVAQGDSTDNITVNITGGIISGYYGIYEYDTGGGNEASSVEISISGDDTVVTGTAKAVYSQNASKSNTTVTITGGTFNTSVAEYIDDSYYELYDKTAGTYKYYESYEEAAAVADDGSMIMTKNAAIEYALGSDVVTIVFYANGGEISAIGEETLTIYAVFGDEIELPQVSKSGYTLDYWELNLPDAFNSYITVYNEDSIYEVGEDDPVEFTAQWDKDSDSKSGGGGSSYSLDEKTPSDDDDEEEEEVYTESEIKLNTEEHFQYISGYPDGTVRPNANITRAEVATIFYRLLDDDTRNAYYSTYSTFDDVDSSQWYLKVVATLTNAGILHGDAGSNTFRPDDNITRAEFATVVSFFDEIVYTDEDAFSDISGHWANLYINSAYQKGWVVGYNGRYNPDTAITRAEAITLINNVLGREVDEDGLHADTKQWPDNYDYAWYYYEVLEATNYHEYVRDSADEAEEWTEILPNKVWNEGAA
ncbi:MAG: S-layer homology domain-containing protein, partial [Clostridiales bacterium]|nr:S-layer homology domain-containing protein [Clostridiales bacterium]